MPVAAFFDARFVAVPADVVLAEVRSLLAGVDLAAGVLDDADVDATGFTAGGFAVVDGRDGVLGDVVFAAGFAAVLFAAALFAGVALADAVAADTFLAADVLAADVATAVVLAGAALPDAAFAAAVFDGMAFPLAVDVRRLPTVGLEIADATLARGFGAPVDADRRPAVRVALLPAVELPAPDLLAADLRVVAMRVSRRRSPRLSRRTLDITCSMQAG